ncbi:MAG: hypothetical protein HOO91_20905 [Bacteroidales bacterium]|nr:hypothetical protein [Bacteroidales bacterium]
MNKTILKSIGAVLAGFIFVAVISIATDVVLTKTGIMKQPFDLNGPWFIISVIFYRSIYTTVGSLLTARLAPNKPMRHSMIGGAIGFVISIIGAIGMWDKPPHWYGIALIIIALPCAWLGGQLFVTKFSTK